MKHTNAREGFALLIKVALCNYSGYIKPDRSKGDSYLFGNIEEDLKFSN